METLLSSAIPPLFLSWQVSKPAWRRGDGEEFEASAWRVRSTPRESHLISHNERGQINGRVMDRARNWVLDEKRFTMFTAGPVCYIVYPAFS